MKRATVKIGGAIKYGPVTLEEKELQQWITDHKSMWGADAKPEVKDESGVVITPAVPAEYELIVEDIEAELQIQAAKVTQKSVRIQAAKALIKNTDKSKLTTVASLKTLVLAVLDIIDDE